MKYSCLAILLLLLVCCKQKPIEVRQVSDDQANITKWFNAMRTHIDRNTDSIYMVKIDKAVINEPDEYLAMAAIARGIFYAGKAANDLAIKNYEESLLLSKNQSADTLRAIAFTGIGNCYKNTGNYPSSLLNFYKALKIYDTRNHKIGISAVNAFLGEVYLQKNDFKTATEYLDSAMVTLKNQKWRRGWIHAAHTLANAHGMNGDYKTALEIDEEGIRIADSINSPDAKAMFFDNKANCFMYSGKLDSAQYYFDECLKIDLASDNKKQIADTYSNLGDLASLKKDFKKAEQLTLKSISIFKTVNNGFNLSKSYDILANVYLRQGDYKKAYEARILFQEEYKRMIDEKKEAALTEFKILHETDQKERELSENKVLLLQKNVEVGQRNTLLLVLFLLVLFLIIIGVLIYRSQKLRNQQLAQEHELKTAISKIETQNELQNQRLEISRDLHDNIGAQLTFIISSVDNIKYAFKINNSTLDTKLHSISSFAKDTIVELRDTIWAMNNNEISFDDLRSRILNFIGKAKEASENVDFTFEVASDLDTVQLTSIVGMNIYRTIQEAVNNALKYAAASSISIRITRRDNNAHIEISDNGTGFDTENVLRGNGLSNMEKRIEDIDGTIKFQSVAKTGTTIEIEIPIPYFAKS